MKIQSKYYKFIFFIVGLLLTGVYSNAQTIAKKGTIDLSDYKFNQTGSIELNGVWEFYPNKLYTPEYFKSQTIENPIYVNVPSLWNETFFPNNEKPNIGYGTYRLKLKFADNIELLSLRLKRIESSYNIWFGDSLIAQIGNVSNKKENAISTQKTISKTFQIKNKESDLIIQVANFHHRKGGIDNSIILGTPHQIISKKRIAGSYEMSILGVLLIMAVFHIGLFFFGRKDYSLLFFSLLLISEIVSLSTNGEVLLTSIFPELPWIWLKKIDYISNFFRISFFALFFYQLYSHEISKLYIKILLAINILMTIFVLFTNLSLFSFTLFIFIILSAATIIYILFAQIKAIFNKKEGAVIPFVGTFILLMTSINDTLLVSDIIQTIYLTPFGLFIFIFSQSYILSFNFSNLYKKTEELNLLTSDIDQIKSNLLNRTSFDLAESLETLVDMSNATDGFIFSVLKEKEVLKSKFFSSADNSQREIYPENLIKKVISEKTAIIVSNIEASQFYDSNEILYNILKSSVCIPLIALDKVRAVLYLESSEKRSAFSEYHTKLIDNLSDQIIGLIDNTNMYRELEDLNLNLEKIVSNRTKNIRKQRDFLEEQKDEIEAINVELTETLDEISQKNKIITDSIKFANLTQESNLPDIKIINTSFEDNFILYRPKEKLSGDFYWSKIINTQTENKIFFSVADCTGHGVPGALMSVIGHNLLNNSVINKNIHKPADILNDLQQDIDSVLGHEEDAIVKDGMDLAIISYDKKERILEYAGAKIDLIIFRNGKLTEVKADKISIGAGQHIKLKEKKFTNHKLRLKKDDIVYIYSDGFQDQFGGESDSKFMKKNFRLLLQEINQLPFKIQRSRMLKILNKWQGSKIQNDDILVAALKF